MLGRAPPIQKPRGSFKEYKAKANRVQYEKRAAKAGQDTPTKRQDRPGKSYVPASVDRRERRLRAQLALTKEDLSVMQAKLRSAEERAAAERILREAEHAETIDGLLAELEEMREKAKLHDSKAPLDFRRPDGSYSSEFTLMCAKVLNSGVAASRASDVIEIVIEFATKRKLASKPSERTHGRIIRVIFRCCCGCQILR